MLRAEPPISAHIGRGSGGRVSGDRNLTYVGSGPRHGSETTCSWLAWVGLAGRLEQRVGCVVHLLVVDEAVWVGFDAGVGLDA